jgi:hypothetical protein
MAIGSLVAGFVGGGTVGSAITWYIRSRIERRWADTDRRVARAEADLQEQLRLLRDLNGDLRNKWRWLTTHRDAADPAKATPAANEIATWLYKHSAYFPEKYQRVMSALADMTFFYANVMRESAMQIRGPLDWLWDQLQKYQRELEKKLLTE